MGTEIWTGTPASPSAAPIPTNSEMEIPRFARRTAKVENYFFSPGKLTINRGTTVTWRFITGGSVDHTVTVKSGPVHFSSRKLFSGTYSHSFTRAGTYHLICTIHPDMTATITVH